MTVRLYEGDKNETGGAGIEITDNKVVNLKLRDENNLIIINEDDEAYVDLQLPDGIANSDNLPIGVNVGRVLQADGRPVTGTLLSGQTTSGDRIKILYGDDGEIKVDNGTGTWKDITTAYFKTQAEYDNLPSSKNSDGNLYIIVDNHITLLPLSELIQLTPEPTAILTELNTYPEEYKQYYYEEGRVTYREETGLPAGKYMHVYSFSTDDYGYGIYETNLTEQEIIDAGVPQQQAEIMVSGEWFGDRK